MTARPAFEPVADLEPGEESEPVAESAIDCESCGACCSYSWQWPTLIGDGDGEGIPAAFIENGRMRCDGDRCVALSGTIGDDVSCRVYQDRPLVCREFEAGSDECRRIRVLFQIDPHPAGRCRV